MLITMEYAKCTEKQKIALQNNIYSNAAIMHLLFRAGNFNAILYEDEKNYGVISQSTRDGRF